MQARPVFEYCNWENPTHTNAYLSLLDHYMRDPMGNHPPLNQEEQTRLIRDLQAHPTAKVVLMKQAGEYVGMTTLFVNYSTFKLKPYLYVHDVVVLNQYRGQGFGKALIDHLITLSKEKGYCKISLEVREDNPVAQQTYKQAGFLACQPDMYYWEKTIN
jgi:ribosomal protein S18 acetylase RimI-like enzyme